MYYDEGQVKKSGHFSGFFGVSLLLVVIPPDKILLFLVGVKNVRCVSFTGCGIGEGWHLACDV